MYTKDVNNREKDIIIIIGRVHCPGLQQFLMESKKKKCTQGPKLF